MLEKHIGFCYLMLELSLCFVRATWSVFVSLNSSTNSAVKSICTSAFTFGWRYQQQSHPSCSFSHHTAVAMPVLMQGHLYLRIPTSEQLNPTERTVQYSVQCTVQNASLPGCTVCEIVTLSHWHTAHFTPRDECRLLKANSSCKRWHPFNAPAVH